MPAKSIEDCSWYSIYPGR